MTPAKLARRRAKCATLTHHLAKVEAARAFRLLESARLATGRDRRRLAYYARRRYRAARDVERQAVVS